MPPYAGRYHTPEVPAWVKRLAMPVWITTSGGLITYMNGLAESLIGQSLADCAGHACYLVVAARTPEGAPLCSPQCRVRRTAAVHESMAPIPMKLTLAGGEFHDVTLVVIPTSDEQLVHCIVDTAHQVKLRGFIDRVALRTPHDGTPFIIHHDVLTAREREVLSLLAQDMTQQEIAERTGISYVTVRNHVQHILNKLGVHSILEAIAVTLIEDE